MIQLQTCGPWHAWCLSWSLEIFCLTLGVAEIMTGAFKSLMLLCDIVFMQLLFHKLILDLSPGHLT